MDDLKFDDLSPSALQVICNGAGPKGLGWLIPEFWFTAAADRHDFDYWMGGGLTDKLRADVRFYAHSLLGLLDLRWWQIPIGLVLAHLYFLAVSVLGWCAWHWCCPARRRGWSDLYELMVRKYGSAEKLGIFEDAP
jgi:hypothetical protein